MLSGALRLVGVELNGEAGGDLGVEERVIRLIDGEGAAGDVNL